MLKVRSNESNRTTIETDNRIVLISYNTPVAYIAKKVNLAYQTDEKRSVTTTKHINRFFKEHGYDMEFVCEVNQEQVERCLEGE